jgi:putative restriction endonuclease
MANAVFTTRLSPSYDDVPEERYHFPARYLSSARAAIGDWIIYYEPRRAGEGATTRTGRQAYFAMARVADVTPDRARDDHFYALIESGSYINFVEPVPFRSGDDYYESRAQRKDGGTSKGWFGWSVRPLPADEFQRIAQMGMTLPLRPYERPAVDAPYGLADEGAPFEYERPRVEQTLTRPYRDKAFRRIVRDAYENRCAVSGLRLLNGGGRPEVQAAHIKAVENAGPDSVRNGLALSGTFHWLFDRGLISIDKDYTILRAKGQIPEELLPLFPRDGMLRLPQDARLWPHDAFMRHHRETRFKG